MTSPDTVGARYRSARTRLTALLEPLTDAEWSTPVPACPGWEVRDVLAHLVGIIEDAAAGRIDGPPSPEQTAEEVARHRCDDPRELLATWTTLAPLLEDAVSRSQRWPAFLDVLSHEHDVRGALGRDDHRDHDDVRRAAELLSDPILTGSGRIVFALPGAPAPAPGDLVLSTTPFELLRLRLGRRSRAQLEAMQWSREPGSAVTEILVFGPAASDLSE